MTEVKHTPGPWSVELNKRAWGWVEVKGPSFAVHGPTQATDLRLSDEVRRVADAHLIAAAPDLLEELKRTRDDLMNIKAFCTLDATREAISRMIQRIDAAIAKAEGRA